MALIEMIMPKMGESIFECTVLNWLKNVGDKIEADDMILEVATDKIDTEIGASHSGIIKQMLVQKGEIAVIGKPICIIETNASEETENSIITNADAEKPQAEVEKMIVNPGGVSVELLTTPSVPKNNSGNSRFYSPLVLNIAKEEGVSAEQLDSIIGTGLEGRVTKDDIFAFLKQMEVPQQVANNIAPTTSSSDQIIEMDRMRKMIAERMVESKRISPHVTSFVEADMTHASIWREKVKGKFKQDTGENITYTPLLIEAVVKAIKDFPMINVQVDGDKIIRKGKINIGMAVALPNGNLIVPVIHEADSYSLIGLTKKINDLTNRARNNKLKADDLADGTLTVSNIGSFGNIAGTPIIVQPQVAILAFGVIQKKVAVIETPLGDTIGIRQKMIISGTYDHRVIDGSLGGQFLKRVSDYLDGFDLDKKLF
ncbi:Dihydrolipoyllysine-residue acetyltransferase component of pyruvate dehydrogenase complex [Emticicia aquatica]|uniref:Dihydrolipoamide acetyltransferase component of pyruvate dehydrogenase complex n=1 Tax=Emticicia aquatica TaxID=1681835 RepID=A0ABN8EU66_9BACT|nr:dihydrolipoamide acetyltransferase family protein [Emticicia aquatica]CAH0995030.1 Dihydrolipoyllysine-residue acetyltransferase component of pyruvate dehydrogenase complex [Emticicia aquatica]